MADGNGRRVRVLHVSNAVLAAMFRRDDTITLRVRIDGMPKDARIVNVSDQTRFLYDQTSFLVESATFDEVPPGNAIPELELTVHELPDVSGYYIVEGRSHGINDC